METGEAGGGGGGILGEGDIGKGFTIGNVKEDDIQQKKNLRTCSLFSDILNTAYYIYF